MNAPSEKNFKSYSRTLLHGLYYYAKFLGVINCRYDKDRQKMQHVQRTNKCVARTLRFILIVVYMVAFGSVLNQYEADARGESSNLIINFNFLQRLSVWIFAVFVLIVQLRNEATTIELLNNFVRLFKRVAQRSYIDGYSMLTRKFLVILLMKFLATLLGYLNELPTMLYVDGLFENLGWFGIIYFAAECVGVYLWIGSMFVLDACVLGLLIIALMYEQMGEYIKRLLKKMAILEEGGGDDDHDNNDIENNENVPQKPKVRLSNHRCMKILCECADIISECDYIYAELYRLTKCFQRLFQWQIFYYIYYNFMVVLLTFHSCIWNYLHTDHIDKLDLLLVFVKIANLALLIMCADFVVQRAHMPQLLCLDVVCSDMDDRWCMSVETFLNRRQTERLEITVLGFFQLNNEFILLILSAIISYLFIIIQFGLNDKMTR